MGFAKEDTAGNQCYVVFPEEFNPNIGVYETVYGREAGRVACNAQNCFYKVGQLQLCKGKYAFIFEELATDDSNASFEQCRVVLVCRFSDHKCRRGNVYTARQYKSL